MREHWALDPGVVFLNHGSFGACPTAVLAVQSELRARMEREPVQFLACELEGLLDAAREEVARFVGARPEDLAFVRNATSGVNAVLRSLRFEPGDELLTTNQTYNACRNVLEFVAERSGARVTVAPVPFPLASEGEVIEPILAAVTPRTRIALVDHVTSPTGLVFPLERIVRELEARGVDTLVDGAHAPGMLALDVKALGAAYYAANFHKWTCAPKGAGMLWVRADRQRGIHPAVISHGYGSQRSRSKFLEEMDWVGSDDPTPALCVPEAIRFIGSLVSGGWDEVRRCNRALALEARGILCEALGAGAPAPASMIGSLAAVPLPHGVLARQRSALYVDALQQALFDRHRIEVPVPPFPAPPARLLRVSAHLYNTVEEYRVLGRALAGELRGE